MANAKIISIVDHEITRARLQSIADLETVQTQIISKINEVLAAVGQLRSDVDALMGAKSTAH